MKRLLICSNLFAILTGFLVFAIAWIGSLTQRAPFDPSSRFMTIVGGTWIIVCPLMLIGGLIALPKLLRLNRVFQLTDLWPRDSGYQRVVTLRVAPGEFLDGVRSLLARTFTIVRCTDQIGEQDQIGCRIRFDINNRYDIRVRIGPDRTTAVVTVLRPYVMFFGARLAPFELGAAQVLAGIVKWAADHELVASDAALLGAPARLEADLGWLRKVDAGDDAVKWAYEARPRPRLFGPESRFFWIALALGLPASIALIWIDQAVRPIPKLVQFLPMFVAFYYVWARVVHREDPTRRQSRSVGSANGPHRAGKQGGAKGSSG